MSRYRGKEVPKKKKFRRKRRSPDIILLLNGDIRHTDVVRLSVLAQASLISLGIETLAQLKQKIEDHSLKLDELGLATREELAKIFKKNKIKLPSNWFWGLDRKP